MAINMVSSFNFNYYVKISFISLLDAIHVIEIIFQGKIYFSCHGVFIIYFYRELKLILNTEKQIIR